MKARIRLDTITDIGNFVFAVAHATGKNDQVWVTDGKGSRISATSFLGLIATREFNKIYVESDKDIYGRIQQFIIEEDAVNVE